MAPVAVLVGAPGSGKSTVGAALADALGVGFRDTDDDVERLSGRTIEDIFLVSGEEEFRRLEVDAVRQALVEHDGVLALGGGAVESRRTRDHLAEVPVVYLVVGANEAAKRVGISGPRPVVLGNVRSKWNELLSARDPWYREVATVTIATDDLSVADIVDEIRHALEEESP